ncbi:alanine--tRNA ligase, chloroplastic/mitochondrial isoform X4 [Cryptomeria japonica]|uniref:alanine--tRNA ligase, chloroplastic/mitochondrial isoform X4 n=1 Tax=Cryptomeria japonica TaxID=3369 RepID=UPI0027DA072B|nr:alanine--tRNA ligase, chloroplastic/mitochondrial isoform X4 [Cryptomeria japonica]XP_059077361.1 alanine--tRNA ligase, chloroplastic/mitochondrial isoform X4 [Cryptomeria japonica]
MPFAVDFLSSMHHVAIRFCLVPLLCQMILRFCLQLQACFSLSLFFLVRHLGRYHVLPLLKNVFELMMWRMWAELPDIKHFLKCLVISVLETTSNTRLLYGHGSLPLRSMFKLPAERLWISIFKDDDEAFRIWNDKVGVPEERIKRMGEEDNFWSSGPTGPCGPCSEIYYDFYPDRGYAGTDLGDGTRFIEFYNLVFMQYNRNDDGSLENLESRNIDTGMGLERMAQILQKVPNNYETDLIYPIVECAAELAGVKYGGADNRIQTHLKVIGDHMRAIVYLISDGVTPSNIGRGYVVRRLIRRVVRTGRLLGIKGDGRGDVEGAFLPIVARTVIDLSKNIDPDVKASSDRILEELRREELRFVQTLERGEKLLDQLLCEALESAKGKDNCRPCLSGKDVFILYDTYGFPIEITNEVAEEKGVSVDLQGFEAEMDIQRRQSQAAHNVVKLSVGSAISELTNRISETSFLGYDTLQCSASIVGLLVNGIPVAEASKGDEVEIVLNKTPFYAESGGQIGDHGFLSLQGSGENISQSIVEIIDVQKSGGSLFVHRGLVKEGKISVGTEVNAAVDAILRQRAKVHHTATHLLQSALKKVVGNETSQAGSLVAFDRLRFDFNLHRPMSEHEITKVESLVNTWIGNAVPLQSQIMPLSDAKQAGAIAMFGEKYGDEVRVVEVPGVSKELCGGTHVSNTAEIRGFKIISEQGIASGIRRIEAVAGEAFIEYVNSQDGVVKQLCSTFKVKVEDIPRRVDNLLEELRTVRNETSTLRAKMATMKASMIVHTASVIGTAEASMHCRVLVANMDDLDAESLKAAAEHLLSLLNDPAAIVLGSSTDGKVNLVAAFSPKIVKCGLQAGKFVGNIARLCGGGGGGRQNFAQAGGRNPEKLIDALEKARTDLELALSTSS